jgi:hypothetical protein
MGLLDRAMRGQGRKDPGLVAGGLLRRALKSGAADRGLLKRAIRATGTLEPKKKLLLISSRFPMKPRSLNLNLS